MDGNDLPERMRVAIARDGRTQGEIAKRLGWAPSKMSGYVTKSGKAAMPGADTLGDFARELGVSLDWLILDMEPMYPEDPDAERQAYRDMVEIVRRTEAARAAPSAAEADDLADRVRAATDASEPVRRAPPEKRKRAGGD